MPKLMWTGRGKVVNYHKKVPFRFLDFKYNFGEASENKIIHGDNLEVLKSLLPYYESKIKCIYIDPPYNTGNEGWIYNDNVNDPQIQKWLNQVVGKEGEDFNRHDKWLCMMYLRLKLMQQLLSEEGYIFISINFKDEYHHLRCICDEIFGVNNYVGTITWESTTQPINSGNAKFGLQNKTEPILFYKGKTANNIFKLVPSDNENSYPHQGKFGKCRFEVIEKSDAGDYKRPTMKFKILGQYPREGKRWQIGEDTARKLEAEGKVEIVNGIVKKAIYPEDEIDKIKYLPFWSHFKAEEYGTAQNGKEILNTIMNEPLGFDTVKPPKLIEGLLKHLDNNMIILDAFAGSGTTAHAVINLNQKDGGNRKFILIESMDYCENITAERVRRVGGNFNYYELGEPLFINKELNPKVELKRIREYIYYSETRQPLEVDDEYYLGTYNDTAYYFCYNHDENIILDRNLIDTLNDNAAKKVIYASACNLSGKILFDKNITFKKIQRDIMEF